MNNAMLPADFVEVDFNRSVPNPWSLPLGDIPDCSCVYALSVLEFQMVSCNLLKSEF